MVAVWGKRLPGELPVRALLRASPGPNHQQLVIAAEASSVRNEGQSERKVDESLG